VRGSGSSSEIFLEKTVERSVIADMDNLSLASISLANAIGIPHGNTVVLSAVSFFYCCKSMMGYTVNSCASNARSFRKKEGPIDAHAWTPNPLF
jgi:hypothetical protein